MDQNREQVLAFLGGARGRSAEAEAAFNLDKTPKIEVSVPLDPIFRISVTVRIRSQYRSAESSEW